MEPGYTASDSDSSPRLSQDRLSGLLVSELAWLGAHAQSRHRRLSRYQAGASQVTVEGGATGGSRMETCQAWQGPDEQARRGWLEPGKPDTSLNSL